MSDLDRILELFNTSAKLDKILANQEKIMSAVTDLQASEAALKAIADKAITLLADLKSRLDAAGTDPAALAALKADMDAEVTALQAEITKDTPAS